MSKVAVQIGQKDLPRVVARARAADPAESEATPAPVIPHAYALVQDPSGSGWHALHLEGVSAQKITRLEPNTRPEPPTFAVSRVSLAIERQFRQDMRDSAARGRARQREAAVKP